MIRCMGMLAFIALVLSAPAQGAEPASDRPALKATEMLHCREITRSAMSDHSVV